MKKISRAGGLLRAAGSAFTLLEVLVAVGAIAIISVGMASIFQAVGKTVTGAQRVSTMTQYAALIERQLRSDFLRITREGFLVIRNQNTTDPNNGQPMPVFQNPDDPNPKVRRIDEILFFTKGECETSRQPINTEFVAKGSDAMVYYGHGLIPQHRSGQVGDVRPDWNNTNDPTLTGWLGQSNYPNAYASNWSLLRRQVVLAQPVASRQAVPSTGWPADLRPFAQPNAPTTPVMDKDSQIACQPAASSIFRSIARVMYDGGNQPARAHFRWDGPPRLSSGMVDVATSDFGEIRTMVQTFPNLPQNITTRADADQKWTNPGTTGNGTWVPGNNADLNRMRAWMCDALPTQSDMQVTALSSASDPKGARVRYEDYPPDYLGTVTAANGSASILASRRGDQLMLAGSKFVPRCTQFQVEWTFSLTDPVTGAAVWYGTSLANNNFTQYVNTIAPYPGIPFTVDRRVVYGYPVPGPNVTQTACFGYVDPTYAPRVNNTTDPKSVPWMWPRMVRVTITIADERDPTIEETFQWEFDLPRPPTV